MFIQKIIIDNMWIWLYNQYNAPLLYFISIKFVLFYIMFYNYIKAKKFDATMVDIHLETVGETTYFPRNINFIAKS